MTIIQFSKVKEMGILRVFLASLGTVILKICLFSLFKSGSYNNAANVYKNYITEPETLEISLYDFRREVMN